MHFPPEVRSSMPKLNRAIVKKVIKNKIIKNLKPLKLAELKFSYI